MTHEIMKREIEGMDEAAIRARLGNDERVARVMTWLQNIDGNRLQIAISYAKAFGTERDIVDFIDKHNSEDPRGFAAWILDHHATIIAHEEKTNEAFMDNARQLDLSASHESAGIAARWFLDRVRQGLIDTDSKSFTQVTSAILHEITREDEDGEWPAIDPEEITVGKGQYRIIQADRESMLAAARTIHQYYGIGPIPKDNISKTAIQIDDSTYIAQSNPEIIAAHLNETMASFVIGNVDLQEASCLATFLVDNGEWELLDCSPGFHWPEDINETGSAVLKYLRENIAP